MTKDQVRSTEEALGVALEALEEVAARTGARWALEQGYAGHLEAITAIKQARSAPVQEVSWGVDWGKAGDIPCVTTIKRLPEGGIQVVAVEYAPYSYTTPPAAQPTPVQEPVAWRWTNGKGWLTYGEIPHDRFESTPLYTTPPAAQPAVPDAITDNSESPDYIQGWNDCRAAMLEARP